MPIQETRFRVSKVRGHGLFWRVFLVSLCAEVLAIVAFFGLEWSWLRKVNILWLHITLPALGCPVKVNGYTLDVLGHPFEISSYCTYVDLMICSFPLLWRVRRRLAANLAVLAGFAGIVALVNLARVLLAVYGMAKGASMFWAHDIEDYVLWYPTISIAALFWFRYAGSLWRESANDPSSSRGNEALSEMQKAESGNPKFGIEVSLLTSAVTGPERGSAP